MNRNRECQVNELHEQIVNGEKCTIIDVREYPEYAVGRVPGAKLVPLSELTKSARQLDRSQPIYLICRSGRRSSEAQQQLLNLGFQNVRSVAGGISGWQQAGYPLERDQTAPWSLERQVRLVAGALVLLGVILSELVSPLFIWLSGFVGAGLVFAAITNTCGMAMLLARLPWNRSPITPSCSIRQEPPRG